MYAPVVDRKAELKVAVFSIVYVFNDADILRMQGGTKATQQAPPAGSFFHMHYLFWFAKDMKL